MNDFTMFSKMLIQRVGTNSLLEMELLMHIDLVYSTKMFRRDI